MRHRPALARRLTRSARSLPRQRLPQARDPPGDHAVVRSGGPREDRGALPRRPARGEEQGPAGCGRETSRGMKAGPRIGPAAEVGGVPHSRETRAFGPLGCGGRSTGRRASLWRFAGLDPGRSPGSAFVLVGASRLSPKTRRCYGSARDGVAHDRRPWRFARVRPWVRPCDHERGDRQRQRDCPLSPRAQRVQGPDRRPREDEPVADVHQAVREWCLEPADASERDDDRPRGDGGRGERDDSQGDTRVGRPPSPTSLSPHVTPTAQTRCMSTKAVNTPQTMSAATRAPFEDEVGMMETSFEVIIASARTQRIARQPPTRYGFPGSWE
jgi:hypothetical protein